MPDLKDITREWLKKFQKQAETEVSSGIINNPPEISSKFTKKISRVLREAYAHGYWLNHLYVQELKAAKTGRRYKGKVELADIPNDAELQRLLREFISLEESEDWHELTYSP